ncbi:Rne/Rng family ribonuclease [Paenibacillus sp. CGMCC 1.16610]|uniref:Rne/Rng family ribonuclease n=2 Tax=Paenibacillus TaxID=44249 RepID=A0ABU6DAQ1_9BACL|nr:MULTISPECIES: Rne/Rng family ribonuclease [Paenibacillus]MBA2939294.1 Rne/Rng family ribonuclease [Paenibacillus sp. CGMCC 1.16610]MCY9659004.1 Rne/Rng family ribonuclease [Paenibacillus anseongense]MEB4794828.1 Rne/Rng family ribonuclease [Paenibacillus chondroitinus]MVQ35253.1 Rne/Rng family ribonuclease [Paenibacillus anseongense]
MKQLIIHCAPELTQAALLEEGRLVEYDSQYPLDSQRAGSIYMGRIVNVLPGMQAAFVDIGLAKNAFLYIDDLLPVHLDKQPKIKPSITELAEVGQLLMVQVSKDPQGTKGARVTTHVSIPGRWIVYMPGADYIAISRKIDLEVERQRLKQLAEGNLLPGEGVILRTGSLGQSEEAIRDDLQNLRELWQMIQSKAQGAEAPAQLYQDLDLLPRLARDVITSEVNEVWLNDSKVFEEMRQLLRKQHPSWRGRIAFYDRKTPLFDHFGVTEELNVSFRRKIWLPSGGYLIIDQTEALTVIDVNTGRYTGSINLEQTVTDINREAASEIPRLLRLRNIRGIIIVDFIDMISEVNRAAVMENITQAVRKDRSKTIIVGWTKLGLLEMTRKRK